MEYVETFNDDPGGWYGWISNAAGPARLEVRNSYAVSLSPWWIDYNHAPPGAGYMHLLYMLNTVGRAGEHQRETEGENRFTLGGYPTDFTNARMTLRLKGEIEWKNTQLLLLCQGAVDGLTSGWLLTGQPIDVNEDWSEQTITCAPDPGQWKCLGRAPTTAPIFTANCHCQRSCRTSMSTSSSSCTHSTSSPWDRYRTIPTSCVPKKTIPSGVQDCPRAMCISMRSASVSLDHN